MEITISGKDKRSLKQVKEFAEKLGLQINEPTHTAKEKDKPNGEKLYKLMSEMAESKAFQSIKDPVAWQREIRKDKPLYGREE